MKILQVIPSIHPQLGGPSYVCAELTKKLQQRNFFVDLVTVNDFNLSDVNDKSYVDGELRNLNVKLFKPCRYGYNQYVPSLELYSWLKQNIHNYDLVHLHYLFVFSTTVAGRLASKNGVPYIVSTIGQLAQWSLSQRKLIKQVYSFLFEKQLLKQASGIHCTSEGECRDVKNFGISTPCFKIPIGIYPAADVSRNEVSKFRQEYAIADQDQVILYFSRLHPKKRPDQLIHSFVRLKKEFPNLRLLVAGSGESDYENYLRNLHPEQMMKDVTFLGFIAGKRKELVLSASDIFVLPTLSENFAISIVEAMSYGLAVVCTESVQISEDIRLANAGIVVDDKLEKLDPSLRDLISSRAQSEIIRKNAKEYAMRLEWDQVVDEYIAMYQKLKR
ncbi:MAG: glycosyltransferase [Proteobacteria bacterium]|nr:glycosyltransferase [Pseudomonadota bacterium]